MLRITLITTLLVLNACNSLPPPPKGDTCVVDVANKGAECVPIQASVKRGELSLKDARSFVPFTQMDNYICFSPSTWVNIQTYIVDLKQIVQNHCQ